MKRTKLARQALLEVCSVEDETHDKKWSRKELLKQAQAKCDVVKKKHVKKALSKLERQGLLLPSDDGLFYRKPPPRLQMESDSNDDRSSSLPPECTSKSALEEQEDGNDVVLPFAEILRRRARGRNESIKENRTSENQERLDERLDVDEEIRRLEEELQKDKDGDSSDSSIEEDVDRHRKVSFGDVSVKEIPIEKGRVASKNVGVLCLSALAHERIEPLPESSLPQNKKRTIKAIDEPTSQTSPKKKRQEAQISDGLKQAVKEVLDGYVARSSERLPFYCRVCAAQLPNQNEFVQHKRSDFHKMAVAMERKASYCKLCRKQFTSPVQLKEHMSSRPHKERLQKVTWRQRRGGPVGGTRHASTEQQWC